MNQERYRELRDDLGATLTEEELRLGWHFCPDWDFMLICRDWPEAEACLCRPSPPPACDFCGRGGADYQTPKGVWIHRRCGMRRWTDALRKEGLA